jgi:GTP-binding protein Era
VSETRRCGYVAIVGRPNVGKSTLLNHLIGQKLSITSRKPQTTRHQVLGIKTAANAQMLFVDTPGMHGGEDRALNRFMNRTANSALVGVDIIVMVVDRGEWRDDDERVLRSCLAAKAPLLLAVNKIDLEDNPNAILPTLEVLAARADFAALIPLSALREKSLDTLEAEIVERLPPGPFSLRRMKSPTALRVFWSPKSCAKSLPASLAMNCPMRRRLKSRSSGRSGESYIFPR